MNNRVYFRYSPARNAYGVQIRTRATLALKKVDNRIEYGLAICSQNDNFCRKTGRENALLRMENGMGTIDLSKYRCSSAETDHQIILKIASSLLASAYLKLEKFKHKIVKFNVEKNVKQYKHDPFGKKRRAAHAATA